ncbi:MAG: hypothetical protein Q9178_000071 [Gyalolechia marmorata]
MPALGSSIQDKSGKKFAPKAPVRRAAPAVATEPSTGPSVEPPPIAQIVQQPARSLSPAAPPDPVANASPQVLNGVVVWNDEERSPTRTQNHDVAREDERTQHDSHKRRLSAISHDHHEHSQPTTTEPVDPSLATSTGSSEVRQSTPPAIQSRQPSTSDSLGQPRNESSPRPLPQLPVPESIRSTSIEIPHEDAPAAKRRKVSSNQAKDGPREQPSSNGQAPVPSSSIETVTDLTTPAGPTRASARKVSALPAKAVAASSAKRMGSRRAQPGTADVGAESTSASTQRTQDAQTSTKVRKPRQTTRAKKRQPLQNAAAEIVASAAERTTGRRKGRRGRREREPTPEEAENETIVPEQIKMADLCKDTRKGKKSDMLKALQERNREELVKKKQKELQQLMGDEAPVETEERSGAATSAPESGNANRPVVGDVSRRQEIARQVAGTYVNEDGEIMIDTDSLQVDRHAQAAAERELGPLEAVEENYLSKPAVNSQTHLKREKANSWSEDLTDEFYEALRMFGTDFDMIGRMLRKSRRAIKLKFTREERQDPDRINQTLLGERIAVDVEDFSRRAGEELKETEEHDRMMEEDRKKIEEDAADELRAKEEQDQVRKDQAEQERTAGTDDSSGKENREQGEKEKRKKGKKDGAKQKDTNDGGKERARKEGSKRKGRKKKETVAEDVS